MAGYSGKQTQGHSHPPAKPYDATKPNQRRAKPTALNGHIVASAARTLRDAAVVVAVVSVAVDNAAGFLYRAGGAGTRL